MKVNFNIEKIRCEGCAETIAKALLIVDGISDLTVDPRTKNVTFEAEDQSALDSAVKALNRAGYPPK